MAPAIQWPPPAGSNSRILFPTIPGVTNMAIGAPDDATLARLAQIVRQAYQHRTTVPDLDVAMQYGPVRGSGEFIDSLSAFLSSEDAYGEAVPPERLMATAGATQGLHFVTTTFLRHGDTVFVEDPTYFLMITILRSLGLNIQALQSATSGVGPDARSFKEKCANLPPLAPGRKYRGALYAIPVYSNPTGRCWTPEVMEEIVRVAEEEHVLILSDDVYQMLRYVGPRPPRLINFDKSGGTVTSISSFTKIFSPAARVGWLEAGKPIMDVLANSPVGFSSGGFNHMQNGVMNSVLQLGLQRDFLRDTRTEFSRRLNAVCAVLDEGLPPGCVYDKPQGGYFIWIELPRVANAARLLAQCVSEEGIAFAHGASASPAPPSEATCGHCIRLSFCYYDLDTLVPATRKLCAFLRRVADAGWAAARL